MTDSFDDDGPPDRQSIFFRVVEGLAVVAFVVAVIVWQSDSTLDAARRFAAGWGIGSAPEEPSILVAQTPGSDVRPAAFSLAAAPAGPGKDALDLEKTGSIVTRSVPLGPPSEPMAAATGWLAACGGGTPGFCTASQTLSRPDDPGVETSWTIEKSEAGLVAIWTTPTGVMVSRGMLLDMGDGKPKTVPFDSCGPRSCEVRAKLAADFIALLRSSRRISTGIVLRGGKPVSFDFSREGLPEALAKLGV